MSKMVNCDGNASPESFSTPYKIWIDEEIVANRKDMHSIMY